MKDLRGEPISTQNAGSLEIFERALHALNVYRGDPVAIIDEALALEPDFVMGHILRAHVQVTMWERSVLPAVNESLARLGELGNRSNDRERGHVRALSLWAAGDWGGYKDSLDRLLVNHPRDLLALQAGHLSDFFQGDRETLRGRVARALPFWTRDDPGFGLLHGMHAFGLEECGSYGAAEEAGRHAIDLDADDCWAQHALAHVMEMQARQAEGVAFMESRQANWAQDDNGFQFHNWWHTALFNLDQGHHDRALDIYDRGIHPQPTEIQVMLLDAVALLWRMHLSGIDVGRRWDDLASTYAKGSETGFYAFNDMHAMLTLVASGRQPEAAALLRTIEDMSRADNTNGMMTREVGLPILHAILAFGAGRYAKVVDYLMPVRYRAALFGGSHAQRDILHRTLIEAALRAGDRSLAHALAHERIALKPHCPFTWQLHQRATQ
ncbi:MAG: tetratricopeptide repeat protein [Rhodospirillaceae bacterium]|nr:tetratricopeptide repeat protein [Rhodospirillaceae bacterium]